MKVPSEHDEQVIVCKWLDIIGLTYYAIPNGSNKSLTAQRKFKAEGLKAGVPDLCILQEGGKSLYIEMKRRKGGVVSKDQKHWHTQLKALGFNVHVCKGADDAISTIEKYLPTHKQKINEKQSTIYDVFEEN